jgi:CheY-like chemotaxis protein
VVGDFTAIGIRAAKRGSYLTHHLLSYARKQTLQPQLVELPILLYDIEKLLGRTLGPRIRVTVRTDPTVSVVRADPGQLQTALLNLAINASHAMPDGGSLLIESRAIVEDDQLWVVIAVIDSGTGMDADTMAQATEPFYTTKGIAGTGLGLPMVHGFAEQSGGKLSIASVVGQGTTVALQLPAVAQAAAEPVAHETPALPGAGCILLVDDDSDVLVTTGAFLDKAGFTTIRTGDPLGALARLAAGASFDALVTDYAMPGMNGAELVAEARACRPGLPAVVISGFTELTDSALLGEGVILLHKPFPRDLLVGTLRRLLSLLPPTEEVFHALRPNLDDG